jgi:prephenate dehydrogenase
VPERAARTDTGRDGVNGSTATIGVVGIIGLGLMGGSLARDLAAAGIRTVGCDANAGTLRAAFAAGVVANDHVGDTDELAGAGFAAVCQADVVVLAVPVSASAALLERVAQRCAAARLITDTGSTKVTLEQAAVAAGLSHRFVGGHPLAGAAHSGWAASRSGLYRGARVWLCPTPDTGPSALALARQLWQAVGATTVVTDAASHDAELAGSSHLPQLLATALAITLERRGLARAQLGSGGRDMTRLAGSSPEMWTAICQANAAHIGTALDQFADVLQDLRRLVSAADAPALAQRFEAGRRWADADTHAGDTSAVPGARVAPRQPPEDEKPVATG